MCRVLGEDHPTAVDSLLTIAHCHNVYYAYSTAVFYYILYFYEQCRLGLEEQPKVIDALDKIAYLYRKNEKICDADKSMLYRRKKYKLSIRMYGAENVKTLEALRELARWYRESEYNDLFRKINAYEKLYEVCLKANDDQKNITPINDELKRLYEKTGCGKEEIELRCKELRESDESEEFSVSLDELKYLYTTINSFDYDNPKHFSYYCNFYADEMIRLYARSANHKDEIEFYRQKCNSYHN